MGRLLLRHLRPTLRSAFLNRPQSCYPSHSSFIARPLLVTRALSTSRSAPPSSSVPEAPPSNPDPIANAVPITTDSPALPDGPIAAPSRFTKGNPSEASEAVSDSASTLSSATTVSTDAAVDAVAQTAVEQSSSSLSDILLTPALGILNGVHDVTGLPWWLSIILATFTIRTALLPVTLMTMKNSAVMAALKDEISIRREAVMTAARTGDRMLATARQNEMQNFMRDAGVSPVRVLMGPLFQFPVFISFFISIRRLAANDPTMTTGGIAWFSDLAVSDPTYVLPLVCGATLFAMTEFGGDSGSTAMTPQMKLGMRCVAALSVPMTYWFPSAVFCYWIPNNMFSIMLGTAMRTPSLKRVLGLHIDPATIPGTRASKQLAASVAAQKGGVVNHTAVSDVAAAAASYKKATSTEAFRMGAGNVVKPVLLKTRPSKKSKTVKSASN